MLIITPRLTLEIFNFKILPSLKDTEIFLSFKFLKISNCICFSWKECGKTEFLIMLFVKYFTHRVNTSIKIIENYNFLEISPLNKIDD